MAVVISGTNNSDKITATDGLIDLLSSVNFASEVSVPSFKVGSDIQFGNAGIITATTLVGNVQGNINHTSNLLLQISGSEKFRVGTSGQLGIGGANYGTSGQVLTSGGSSSAATWSTISSDLVSDTSPQLGGDLDVNGKKIKFPDLTGSVNNILYFGTGDDLLIYHLNDINYIQCENSRTLRIQQWTGSGNETLANFIPNGAVELYHNNTKKFETSSTGITATGSQHLFTNGTSGDCELVIAADSNNSNEEHNPRIVFRQDGNAISNSIGVNHPNNADQNDLYIANGNLNGDIGFWTGFDSNNQNNYAAATLRLNITTDGRVRIPSDSGKLQLGASQDLELYHDGTSSIIKNNTGGLFVQSNDTRIVNAANSETIARFIADGAVELYHNNSKKLETISDGVKITGNRLNITDTGSVDLYLSADTDNSDESHVPRLHFVQDGSNTRLIIGSEGSAGTAFSNSIGNSPYLQTLGSLPLVVATNSVGRWQFTSGGHFYPMANNSYDIGSSSYRVRNLYTNDLNLSNEGGSNDVDGTWGDWTLQEGEDKIYMINNRTGKKYSLKMEEE